MRVLWLALAAAAAVLLPAGVMAASGGHSTVERSGAKAPPSYRGTWFGTTAAGGEISFTVNRRNRITIIAFDYEIEGEDCVSRVEDRVRGPIPIVRKAFKLIVEAKQEAVTLTGRFGSGTSAAGRLRATFTDDEGCTGSIATRWQAKKGKKPPADRTYDGRWTGAVSLPGIDPVLLEQVGGILFDVDRGAVTLASVPAVIRGAGCQSVRIPGLGESYDPPVPIRKGAFELAGEDGNWRFSVTGMFTSPTAASGTVVIEGSQSIIGVPFPTTCSGRVEGTWQATREAVGRPSPGSRRPAAAPMPGAKFAGTTSQGKKITFGVSADGRRVLRFSLFGWRSTDCDPGLASYESFQKTVLAKALRIANGRFAIDSGAWHLRGRFTSSIRAAGTLRFEPEVDTPITDEPVTCRTGRLSWTARAR